METGRKRPVHWPTVESGGRAVLLFVTVCTRSRKRILADDVAVASLQIAWRAADHWLVGRYIILPDHIHLFCSPARHDAVSVQQWVMYWKSLTSKHWPRPEQHPIWQEGCWDTQLRREDSYRGKWEYVRQNAVRHGLVERAEDWPYQGELHVLEWHEP